MFTINNNSGSQIKAWEAGHCNLNEFEPDELETICDAAIAHRAKWNKARARKPRCGSTPNSWGAGRAKSKVDITLVAALAARSRLARKRGKRFRRLRPYRVGSSWLLTKMSKGQLRSFLPVCPR